MVKLKILEQVSILRLIFFFTSLNTICDFIVANSSVNFSVGVEDKKNIIELPFSKIEALNRISRHEQNRLMRLKLIQEGYPNNISAKLTRDLGNCAIDYLLLHEDEEDKITELASLLLKPLGGYGSEKGEEITLAQKMSVIHEWLKRSILGMTFLDWMVNEIRVIKKKGDYSFLTHQHLKKVFFEQLHGKTKQGRLSLDAIRYYLDYLLSEDMPSFQLELTDTEEINRLQLMNLSAPEFGYLHVGLKVLQETESESNKTLNLDDIQDVGVFIESVFQEGNMIGIDLFEVPAMIFFASTLDAKNSTKRTSESFYDQYFRYLRQSNPFYQVFDLLNSWKSRSGLAKQILAGFNVSGENWVKVYMDNGDEERMQFINSEKKLVTVPHLDRIFEEQNKNISNSFRKLDKLILLELFDTTMNQDEKNFIKAAEINEIDVKIYYLKQNFVKYLKDTSWQDLLVHYFELLNKVDIKLDNFEFFECKVDNDFRVYALNTNNYQLRRLDRYRVEYFSLINRTDLSNVKKSLILATKISLMKKKDFETEVLINNLAEKHSKKLYDFLKAVGYEETFRQKFTDFLWNLIPFFTCIKELKNENFADAILPCAMDIVGFVPFFGQSINVAYKFGSAVTKASLIALQVAKKQVFYKMIFKQAAKHFIAAGIPQIQKTINSRVYLRLGREFLNGLDPGFGLLKLCGQISFKAIAGAHKYLGKSFSNLQDVAEKLKKLSDEKIISTGLVSADILKTKKIAFLPDLRQEVAVVKVGSQNGNDLFVCIYDELNILFGKKYLADSKSGIVNLAPIPIQGRLYQLKIQTGGSLVIDSPQKPKNPIMSLLSGGKTGRVWATSSIPLTTNVRVNEVYLGGFLSLDEILNDVKGFWPTSSINYDYNLEKYLSPNTSPFVLTSSSLETSIAKIHRDAKNKGLAQTTTEDDIIGYVYKIRPNSKFYNVRESLLAARDVCRAYTPRYEKINKIINENPSIKEYAALNGFSSSRIIEYAPVTWEDDGILPLRWDVNPSYKEDFNSDLSASDLYTRVSIYQPSDALYMALNIVQQVLKITKAQVRSLFAKSKFDDKIGMDLVTKYNTHQEEQILKIQELRRYL